VTVCRLYITHPHGPSKSKAVMAVVYKYLAPCADSHAKITSQHSQSGLNPFPTLPVPGYG
jgi:hypothetical protein